MKYKSRNEVPENEKWDLTDIYLTIKHWEKDFKKVERLIADIQKFEGSIKNGATLLAYLTKQEELSQTFNLVYVFAMLNNDIDTRNTEAQSLLDKVSHLSVKISAATSFFLPFLLSIEEEVLQRYINETDGLKYFEKDLLESYRYKEHILSKEQEQIMSQMGEALSSPSKTFGLINNADIKFGKVTSNNGEKVELTRGMYSKLIEDEDRKKRKEAYKAYYKPYLQMKNSIASTLSASIKNNVTVSKIRHYNSSLEKSLFSDMVPKEVYDNLIETTRKNIYTLHQYTDIRREKLGIETLHQYDLSVSLVPGMKQEISYDQAYDTMLKALKPLGEEYVNILTTFKDKRYIDVRETPGKRSGAYNLGVYGVHPFVLLNYQDQDGLDSLFTLTHECGHAMHSHFSQTYQPRISARYSIFVAEVASTVNEVLLINYLLVEAKDAELKKYLLNHFIDKFRGTFFTQVMFSEFEKITHELAEKGEPLNADVFDKIYGKLFIEYNGESIALEEGTSGWSRIPHFYRPFYVYKYATGFAAAIHIANQLLNDDLEMKLSYLEFLKSGSSDYPLELLKKTGVDLTISEPIEKILKYFSELVNEFSKL